MYTISNTDLRWFNTHRSSSLTPTVNFWSPTPWNVRSIEEGSRIYFMLKHPVRLIGGYGVFRGYETMKVSRAWMKYGPGNGVGSSSELKSRVEEYALKRSMKFHAQPDPEIGCLELTDAVFLDDASFIDPANYAVEFPRQIVKYKSFDELDPFENVMDFLNHSTEFQLVNDKSETEEGRRKKREGQPQFRREVLKAYGGVCCMSGNSTHQVIQAAHIQPYISRQSNHVQNGLPLRSDIHTLFDSGLISVDDQKTILVSARLNGTEYAKLRGKIVRAPDSPSSAPSSEALKVHRTKIYRAE